jgi:hypothetical protein
VLLGDAGERVFVVLLSAVVDHGGMKRKWNSDGSRRDGSRTWIFDDDDLRSGSDIEDWESSSLVATSTDGAVPKPKYQLMSSLLWVLD